MIGAHDAQKFGVWNQSRNLTGTSYRYQNFTKSRKRINIQTPATLEVHRGCISLGIIDPFGRISHSLQGVCVVVGAYCYVYSLARRAEVST